MIGSVCVTKAAQRSAARGFITMERSPELSYAASSNCKRSWVVPAGQTPPHLRRSDVIVDKQARQNLTTIFDPTIQSSTSQPPR